MKRHRKLVALLVALTFLFSIVAPVMAATPSEAEKAADKLNVLGIIEGYPDGSFGLDRNITRAEFAKIAVVAAGLKDAAEQLVNFPSQFSDVKVGEWYTGWINMAASQGFVKGDPAGTFRPNDNITYAEVVTVLVRLLGYNDNLTGPWPTNYLAKAVELGITDGVALNASAPAVRGDVFIMTANTLDCNTVYWNADNLDWTVKAEKLIVKSFKGAMYEGIVTDISWDSKGDIYLHIVDNNGKDYGSIRLVDNVIISGADDAFGLLGKQVEFIRNQKASGADRNAIVYLGEKETESVSKDKAEYDVRYIEIDSKRYDVASGFGVTYFPVSGDFDPKEKATLTGDKVVVVLNEDGEAQWAFVYNYSAAGADVIEEIDGDKVFGFNKTRFEYDEDDIQVFIKDGKIASYDALAEGDLIYVVEGAKNTDALVFAVSEVLEGELEKANADTNELTISGTKIKTDSGYKNLISLDGGKTFDGDLQDVLGEAVKYMLNPAGRVAVIISDVKASQKLVGVVEAVVKTARGPEVRILNPDGTKAVYYVDSDYSDKWPGVPNFESITNVLVQYSLDKNGRIDWVEEAKPYTFEDYDGNLIQLDGKWYRLDDNAGFFGHEGRESKDGKLIAGKLIASNWETFKGVKDVKDEGEDEGEGKDKEIYAIVDKGKVKAVYTTGVIKGSDVGVVADMGYDRNGPYYEIFVDGKKVRYNMADKDATVKKDLKGKLVEFFLASGKISSISDMNVDTYKVDSASSSHIYISAKDTYYYIDEDTMIVDATGSTIKLVSRVGKGDYVQIYGEDDKAVVDIILIVKAPKDEPAPTPAPTPVTYSVEDYNAVHGRFKVEDREGNVKTLFVDEFDGWVIGENEVSLAVMLAWLADKADKNALPAAIVVTEDNVLVVAGTISESEAALDLYAEEWAKALAEKLGIVVEEVEEGFGFKAAFDKDIEVPEVLEGYFYIDVEITLDEDVTIPAEANVEVLYNETKVYDGPVPNTNPFMLSSLVRSDGPALLRTGDAAEWTIIVKAGVDEDVKISGTIRSLISANKQDFRGAIELAKADFTIKGHGDRSLGDK